MKKEQKCSSFFKTSNELTAVLDCYIIPKIKVKNVPTEPRNMAQ